MPERKQDTNASAQEISPNGTGDVHPIEEFRQRSPRHRIMVDDLRESTRPFQDAFESAVRTGDRQAIERFPITARVMVANGVTSELNFFIEKYPETFRDWVENNQEVKDLVSEFGWSSKWLSWALARTYNLDFSNVYRTSRVSPIRRYIGDITVHPKESGFWDESRFKVGKIEAQGADISELYIGSRIERDINDFSKDSTAYFAALDRAISTEERDTAKKVLLEVRDFYRSVADIELPTLKRQITDEYGQARRDAAGHDVLFPSTHQKAAIAKAAREKSLAVFDGTGSGKTAIGIGTAEYVDAKRTLVVCPSTVKQSWEQKIDEYYIEPPEVLRIESENSKKFIENGLNGSKYTIVNYDLLIDRQDDGVEVLSPLGQKLLECDFDLLVLDEAHYINNQNKRSDAVLELAKKIDRRLILTATPIRNGVEDLSRIAHLLDPNEFGTPDQLRAMGPSGVPAIVELLAVKTIRRKTEDLLELPPFAPESEGKIDFVQLDLSPTQQAVYDAIFDDSSIDAFSKIKLLRQVSIDHNLLCGGKYKLPFDEEGADDQLEKAFAAFQKLKVKNPEIEFDSKFLVTHGFRNLFLGGHFKYKHGFESLIAQSQNQEIKNSWTGTEPSTKFQKIGEMVLERLGKGEKVVIFTGHFVKGVLRERHWEDDIPTEEISRDLHSYLSREFPEIGIGRIDGEVTINAPRGKKSKRDLEREKWQKDPNLKVLLTSVSTASLGIDFTVNDHKTTGVSMIGIDLPYTYADLWQMVSRVYRFGQNTPVHPFVLEAEETIDEGVRELISIKEEIAQQLIDGVMPTEMEKKILDRNKESSALREYLSSPKRELWKSLGSMKGKGFTANGQYLDEALPSGQSRGERIAELYSRYWEYTASGHNARLVRQVLDGLRKELKVDLKWIVDAGSGPLILDRTLKAESDVNIDARVISVDLNKHMLLAGIRSMESQGVEVDSRLAIAKPMSETGLKDDSVDAVVCSLAFHNSSSQEDRANILREANRVLKTGGHYLISLHESYLTPEQAKRFAKQLAHFGFQVDTNISGRAKATDFKENPFAVWLFVAKKVGVASTDEIKLEDFHFAFEASKVSKYREDKKKNGNDDGGENGKLVKHEKFAIVGLDDNSLKGSPDEILARLSLGLTEQGVRNLGWEIETRETKDGTNVILRK